jgi:Zn-dependent protease
MQSPFPFQPGQPVTTIGHIFGTPLALQGITGLPVNQVACWALFTWLSMRKRTAWAAWRHLLLGGAKMAVFLGSEWCHNLSHAAAARAVGKPVDAMRLIFGMPVLIYDAPEHPSITPRQHILRSSAGPLCNATLLIIAKLFQRITLPGSPAREIADVGAGMNSFIACAGLLPIPAFDGGPVAKWSLVAGGFSPQRAERLLARVVALQRRRWPLALIFTLLGVLALVAGFGKKNN